MRSLTASGPPGAVPHPGSFIPFAQVDMRTSIRPTVAEVDLGVIRRNFDRMAALVAPSAVWAVVKADAYGHGAVSVARALSDRCAALAVSLVEEGLELRSAGIRAPIVVLGAYYDRCHAQVIEDRLTPVIYDPLDLDLFARAAAGRSEKVDVHVKIDTGMSRLGIDPSLLPAILDRARAMPGIRIAGLCTHFATADGPSGTATRVALERFRACVAVAEERGLVSFTTHAANSAAAVRFPETRLDAVRPGLALYGARASLDVPVRDLEPALRLTTRLMSVRRVPAGTAVSYGARWLAPRLSLIGTLPVGYADGYPRHVESAEVLVRGRRAPVVGAVCMDMMMVDLTDVAGAGVGDAVTLIGRDGTEQIGVDDLARWAGTINYEIFCGISKRVPRIYKD
jgi:alanine racemase